MKTAARHAITVRLDPHVLSAAKARAASDNRTLNDYIGTLLRRDLRLMPSGSGVHVIAPSNIRDYEPVPMPGESRKRRAFRRHLFTAILDQDPERPQRKR